MDFPWLIWKYAEHMLFGEGLLPPHTHGFENCLMETTSHIKMEFSFPFREKKTSEAKFRAQTNSPAVVS